MPTGEGLLARARQHVGEEYRNGLVPKDDGNWHGPWDCAEFASWLVFQESGQIYGCTDPNAAPARADAYTGAWRRDARTRGRLVSVEEAAATAGAMLLRYPPGPGEMGHIAVSDGEGGTVEAKGAAYGVVEDKAGGRRWNTGVLVPGIDYASPGQPVAVSPPALLFGIGIPNMNADAVRRIQHALKAKGFDPGALDGVFGPDTAAAVSRFQKAMGIVADGEVGKDTARLLGLNLPDLAGTVVRSALTGLAVANPLLVVATALLPAIARAVAGDRSGAVASAASQAVAEVTGAQDPEGARARLDLEPGLQGALQIRLAEIANAADGERLAAEAEARRDASAAELQRRDDARKELETRLADAEKARQAAIEHARIGGPSSWGPILVSGIVTVGFFLILFLWIGLLMYYNDGVEDTFDPTLMQIINISIGALTVAFSTVVTFWLGSSEGSRRKDVAAAQSRIEQAERDGGLIAAAQNSAPATAPQGGGESDAPGSNFERCLGVVLAREGGFSDDPRDRGGPTMFGVTLGTLSDWRGHPVTTEDVQALTREEAREIYRSLYWNRMRCDDLPIGVDLLVFDLGVHAGPGASARVLQKSVGAEQDGSIGDATIAATCAARPREVIEEFHRHKLARYQEMPAWATYGKGWGARAEAIRIAAIDMVAPTMIGPRAVAA